MWPANNIGENTRLYNAVKEISDFAINLGMNIPTGKDSLSMTQKYSDGKKVLSPGTVIVSAASEVSDINKVISPVLKKELNSELIYINFCKGLNVSGSAFYQTLSSLGSIINDTKSSKNIINIFNTIQDLIINDLILSGHDISSGGFITSLLEMNFPNSDYGLKLSTKGFKESDLLKILFNESPGIIIQTNKNIDEILNSKNIKYIKLGKLIKERKLSILHNKSKIRWFVSIDFTAKIQYYRCF